MLIMTYTNNLKTFNINNIEIEYVMTILLQISR